MGFLDDYPGISKKPAGQVKKIIHPPDPENVTVDMFG